MWAGERPGLTVISEARLRPGAPTEVACAAARRAGGCLVPGPAGPDGSCLLAAFASVGDLRPGPFAAECPPLGGRVASWLWTLPGAVIAVFGVYGEAGRGDDPGGRNAALVARAAEWAEALGAPALIAGDTNVHDGHEGWAPGLAAAGWADLGAAAGLPACIPSRGAPSRPDRLLASPALAACCGPAIVDWGSGLPAHAILSAPLRLPHGRGVLRAAAARLGGGCRGCGCRCPRPLGPRRCPGAGRRPCGGGLGRPALRG